MIPVEFRFWMKVDIQGDFECWLWMGKTDIHGRGRIGRGRRGSGYIRTHRFSWEIHYGPIPDKLLICHTCDNPRCVNPRHLFCGTRKDNSEDMVRKKRQINGSRHGGSKLTEKFVAKLKRRYAKGDITITALSRLMGLSQPRVSVIIWGLAWKHVCN